MVGETFARHDIHEFTIVLLSKVRSPICVNVIFKLCCPRLVRRKIYKPKERMKEQKGSSHEQEQPRPRPDKRWSDVKNEC